MGKTEDEKVVINYDDLLQKAKTTGKAIFDLTTVGEIWNLGKYLSSDGSLTENDTENVIEIIKAGKRQGVQEMDIEMTREQWMGLKGKTNIGGVDADISLGDGEQTGYQIRVTYK